jgi:hypothetical protein
MNPATPVQRAAPPTTVGGTVAKTDKLIKRVGSRLRGPNNTECENYEFEFHRFPPHHPANRKIAAEQFSPQRHWHGCGQRGVMPASKKTVSRAKYLVDAQGSLVAVSNRYQDPKNMLSFDLQCRPTQRMF